MPENPKRKEEEIKKTAREKNASKPRPKRKQANKQKSQLNGLIDYLKLSEASITKVISDEYIVGLKS